MADSEDEEEQAASQTIPPPHRPAPELTGTSAEFQSAKQHLESAVKKVGATVAIKKPPPPPLANDPWGPPEDNAKLASFFLKEPGTGGTMIFLPDGCRLTTAQLQELFEKTWKMVGPSTMIVSDAGVVHPKKFAAFPLVKTTKSFEGFWNEALQHADRALDPNTEKNKGKPAPTEEEREAFGLGVINDVLFLKLVTVFCSILDASAIAEEQWLLVDRTSAKSPAADVLIEAAMMSTQSRPEVLVVDSIRRLKVFRGESGADPSLHPKTVEFVEKLKFIRSGGVPFGTDQEPDQKVVSQFYEPRDFMKPDEFLDLPLPRAAEPEHLRNSPDGKPPERVRWSYHYLQTFFGSGKRYFVLDNSSDAPDLTGLGRIGYVVANGQGLMAPRLKRHIQAGESIVMLHNTGGVVQAWASIRKELLKFPPPDSSKLLDKLELKSPEEWTKSFGLAEILMLMELHQRAPMLLRTSCVAVDVMRDNSEEVLSTLTCCFAGGGGIPELGLGEAERLCVLTCWKRHLILRDNADKFEKIADNIQVFLYLLGIVTTVLAVFYSQENQARETQAALAALPTVENLVAAEATDGGIGATGPDLTQAAEAASGEPPDLSQETPLGYIMILAPILATLVGTVRTKMRPREKWASCLMASYQIVDQIYRYRLRAYPYDTSKNPPAKEGEEPVDVPVKDREMNARKEFIDTCSMIYSTAIAAEVGKNGALKMGKSAQLQTSTSKEDREKFRLILHEHVHGKLYGQRVEKLSNRVASSGDAKAVAKDLMGDEKKKLDAAKKKKGMILRIVSKTPLAKVPAFKKALDKVNAIEKKIDDGMEAVATGVGQVIEKAANVVEQGQEAVTDAAAKAGLNLNEKEAEEGDEKEADDLGAKKGGGTDDFFSQLSVESYVDARIRPFCHHYLEKRAPMMARRGLILDHIVMLANTAGAVMAVINLSNYVAISVAIASVAMAFQDYFYVAPQLAANNTMLEQTHNLLLFWDSLSLVQRKTGGVKMKLADTMEGGVLNLCSARTGLSPNLPGQGDDGGDES